MANITITSEFKDGISDSAKKAGDSLETLAKKAKKAKLESAKTLQGKLPKKWSPFAFAETMYSPIPKKAMPKPKRLDKTITDKAMSSIPIAKSFGGKGGKGGKDAPSLMSMALDGVGGFTGILGGVFGALTSVASVVVDVAFGFMKLTMGAGVASAALAAAGIKYAADLQSARQSTLFGLRAMLGSQEAAHRAYGDATRIAALTGTQTSEMAKGLQQLVGKGLSTDMSASVLQAMADIKAMNPGADIDKLVLAIGQIKGKGKIQMEELQGQIAEQFPIDIVLKEYAKILKVQGKNDLDKMNKVRDMIKKGKVDADVGIQGILQAVSAQGGGGPLGAVSKAFSEQTAQGALLKLKGQIETAFLAIDLSGLSKGFASFMGQFTNERTGFLDPKSMRGEALQAVFRDIAASAGNMMNAISGKGALKGLFTDLVFGAAQFAAKLRELTASESFMNGIQVGLSIVSGLFQVVGSAIMGFFDGLKTGFATMGGGKADMQGLAETAGKFGQMLGLAVPHLIQLTALILSLTSSASGLADSKSNLLEFSQVFGVIGSIAAGPLAMFPIMLATVATGFDLFAQSINVDGVLSTISSLPAKMLEIGSNAVSSLASGIMSGIGAAIAAVAGLAELLPAEVKAILGIASPSKVFAGLGVNIGAGLTTGIDSTASEAQASARYLANSTIQGATNNNSSVSNSSKSSASIVVNVNAQGGSSSELVSDIGSQVKKVFVELGYSLGGALWQFHTGTMPHMRGIRLFLVAKR